MRKFPLKKLENPFLFFGRPGSLPPRCGVWASLFSSPQKTAQVWPISSDHKVPPFGHKNHKNHCQIEKPRDVEEKSLTRCIELAVDLWVIHSLKIAPSTPISSHYFPAASSTSMHLSAKGIQNDQHRNIFFTMCEDSSSRSSDPERIMVKSTAQHKTLPQCFRGAASLFKTGIRFTLYSHEGYTYIHVLQSCIDFVSRHMEKNSVFWG